MGIEHAVVVRRRALALVNPVRALEGDGGARMPQFRDVFPAVDAGPGIPGRVGWAMLRPPHPSLAASHPRQSLFMEGNLIRRVEPQYPPLGKQIGLEGTVVLKAVISSSGTVEKLEVREGHPLLVKAALEAVRQWRYRPHYLNHEPIEVETENTVKFRLSR